MQQGIVTESLTRNSSFDLSFSDIDATQLEMDIDVISNPETRVRVEEPEQTMAYERDPIYFCEVVTLKAEDRVFCVPKSGLLEHGSFFQVLFRENKPREADGVVAGISEQDPIVLDDVSKIDFHNFLRLLYPFRGVDSPTGDEHWLGILDLATKWEFLEIRELALSHLEHIFTSPSLDRDPIRALFLCQKYNIHQHIKHQYEAIITSITPLDRPAMLAGGIDDETILQLMQLREKWFCGMVWGNKGSGTGFGGVLPCRISAKTVVEAEDIEGQQAGAPIGEPGPTIQQGHGNSDIPSAVSETDTRLFRLSHFRRARRIILLHEVKRRFHQQIQGLTDQGIGNESLAVQALLQDIQIVDCNILICLPNQGAGMENVNVNVVSQLQLEASVDEDAACHLITERIGSLLQPGATSMAFKIYSMGSARREEHT